MASAVSGWSSTSRMRSGRSARGRPGSRGSGRGAAASAAPAPAGRRTVNVAPDPWPALAAVSVPPCSSTIAVADGEAQPQAAERRVIAAPPCSKASKIRGSDVGLDADAGVGDLDDQARPPAAGLRQPRAHRDRAARGGELHRVVEQVPEDLGAGGRRRPDGAWSPAARSVSSRRPPGLRSSAAADLERLLEDLAHVDRARSWSSSLPRTMRVRSSRSSISRASSSTLRRIIARLAADRRPAGARRPPGAETTASTGVSGVRSSWDRVARKWSLAWLGGLGLLVAPAGGVRSVTTSAEAGSSPSDRAAR